MKNSPVRNGWAAAAGLAYDTTGLLLELDVEIEAGFWSVEFDD
jgi:hypothetical protein